MRFAAYIVTCAERRAVLEATLARFHDTDWGADPELQIDDGAAPNKLARIHATWLMVLEKSRPAPPTWRSSSRMISISTATCATT